MNSNEIKSLPAKTGRKEINPAQGTLDLQIDKFTEPQGIGMGVLRNGTPFLNQRGLARLCGVENAHIGTIGTQWNEDKPRTTKVKELLSSRGVMLDAPHMVLTVDGKPMYAYPDTVCLAILEYYAFEAGANCKDEARKNYRILAGKALQDFIYAQVGYDPANTVPDVWREFHDRVSLNHDSAPLGFFSVFKEIADITVTLIRAGARVDEHFVPDISVGQHWGSHWKAGNFEQQFGKRQRYLHNYPEYFAQARSNPQEPHCYPDAALPEFRRWLRVEYLEKRFPQYLTSKLKSGDLPASFVQLAITAVKESNTKKLAKS